MPIGTGNQVIPGLGSHHIAIQTTDYEASVRFYTEVMGMTEVVGFETGGRRALILDIGDGSHMELFEPIPGTQPSNDADGDIVFHFALQTTDIEAAARTRPRRRHGNHRRTEDRSDGTAEYQSGIFQGTERRGGRIYSGQQLEARLPHKSRHRAPRPGNA